VHQERTDVLPVVRDGKCVFALMEVNCDMLQYMVKNYVADALDGAVPMLVHHGSNNTAMNR
jgi:hypothetical protein